MSENSVVPETPAPSVPPSETLFPNEPDSNANPPVEASRIEKIITAGKSIFEKHGVAFKRGGGRPRKDGMPNKLDVPLNAPPTNLPLAATSPGAVPVQGLDPDLVRRCCSAVIKAATGFLDDRLWKKALKAGIPETKAKQILVDCSVTKEECDSFGELATICLQKYGVGSQYAPEVGLAAVIVGVGVRYSLAMKTISREEKP